MLRRMIEGFVKVGLRDELQWARQAMVEQVNGLSDYDIRRPLTATGTNLLGLVKHLTLSEIVYLGDVFDRPFADPHPRFDDPGYRNRDSLWVREDESTIDIIDGYRRAWSHSDATIVTLPMDASGQVPWWPQPEVTLFNAVVHVLAETNRHAGHADILREQLNKAELSPDQASDWSAHRNRIEQAARQVRIDE